MERNTYKVTCILPASYYHEFQIKAHSIEEAKAMAEDWVCKGNTSHSPLITLTSGWEERYNDKIECSATEMNKPKKQYNIYTTIPFNTVEKFTVKATSKEEALKLFNDGTARFVRSWQEPNGKIKEYEVVEVDNSIDGIVI